MDINSNNEFTVSVIMPVYNEENTLKKIINKVLKQSIVNELIVVDDCSSDGSAAIVNELYKSEKRIKFFQHNENMGKCAALKTAIKNVSGDIIIIQDADLEYDPGEYNILLEPIMSGEADVVYGSRFLVRKATRVLYYYHSLANKTITFLSNFFTNLNMTDIETCYKVFKTPIVKNMILNSKGFGFEVEVTSKIGKLFKKYNLRIYETPISYYGRTYEEGKKIGFSDGLQALFLIFKYNLFVSRKKSFSKCCSDIMEEIKPQYPKQGKQLHK